MESARPGHPGSPARPGGAVRPGAPGAPATPAGPVMPAVPAAGPVMPTQAGTGPVRTGGPVSAPTATGPHVRREAATADTVDVNGLLGMLVKARGSDLHLAVGAPPFMRVHGDITPMPGQATLMDEALDRALIGLLSENQVHKFRTESELDFAYTVEGIGRFRGNMFKQRHNTGAVFRLIPSEITPLETLGMPAIVNSFATLPRGLVLVTGPTGSGKSTTLAALVDRVNRTRNGHIMTVEDPIEFLHDHRGCVVNQREVGEDTASFNSALKHVLRQDPDVILVGELRDLETISIALTAAETGHLVFATLHTQSAQDTVNRVIDVFPGDQQSQIRSQLAATLKGVVCQTLLKAKDGRGRVAATEVMLINPAIATMIRRAETHQIPQALQSGGQQGMMTLNQHLAELAASGVVSREDAEVVASDLKDFETLYEGAVARGNSKSKASSGQGGRGLGMMGG